MKEFLCNSRCCLIFTVGWVLQWLEHWKLILKQTKYCSEHCKKHFYSRGNGLDWVGRELCTIYATYYCTLCLSWLTARVCAKSHTSHEFQT